MVPPLEFTNENPTPWKYLVKTPTSQVYVICMTNLLVNIQYIFIALRV